MSQQSAAKSLVIVRLHGTAGGKGRRNAVYVRIIVIGLLDLHHKHFLPRSSRPILYAGNAGTENAGYSCYALHA